MEEGDALGKEGSSDRCGLGEERARGPGALFRGLSEGPLWERSLWGGGDLLEVKRRLLEAGRRGGRDGWGGLFKDETSGSRETMKIPGSSPHGMYAA